MAPTKEDVFDQFDRCVIANYRRLPIVITRAEGSTMWDIDGKAYLDFFPGWAVSGLGHCHPRVVEAIRRQAGELIHIDNTFYSVPQGQLAEMLSQRSFTGKCFFCNSGAEAVEAAMKLARLAGGEDRYKIVTMEKSFHGRTFAAMTATGQAKTHNGFQPLVPGFTYVPFNDFSALADAVDDKTIAVMLEPIQGEGGIRIAEPEYLRQVRQLCDERKMVLIFDEVQTGMGRTGKWFAYQHYDIVPDVLTLAKALGGGVSIGAIVAGLDLAEFMKPGTHASTFGGNPLACSAAIAVIEAIDEGDLLTAATEMGGYLKEKLDRLAETTPLITEVRQMGLMVGADLAVEGAGIVDLALENGLRVNCTQQTVLRMIPAMTVTREQIDKAIEILEQVFAEYRSRLGDQQREG